MNELEKQQQARVDATMQKVRQNNMDTLRRKRIKRYLRHW